MDEKIDGLLTVTQRTAILVLQQFDIIFMVSYLQFCSHFVYLFPNKYCQLFPISNVLSRMLKYIGQYGRKWCIEK